MYDAVEQGPTMVTEGGAPICVDLELVLVRRLKTKPVMSANKFHKERV